jgi:hypothetical protein
MNFFFCVGGVPQSSCQGFSESSGSTPHKAGLHIIFTQQSKSEEEYETEDDTTITEVLCYRMIDNYDDYNFTHTVCVCVCVTHTVCVCV